MSTSTPAIGPVAMGILITDDLQATVKAYCDYMRLAISVDGRLDASAATGIGDSELENHPYALLANSRQRPWLLVIEDPEAPARDALTTFGWLAMEVLVESTDALAATLKDSPFTVLRPPANLAVSDDIRACQVRGPAGEVLYLTEVKAAVPPFDLPTCEAWVDHLFIPVLATPDRNTTLSEYEQMADNQGIAFATRITVLNQALDLPLETEHPVATLQLAGQSLIEMDQVDMALPAKAARCKGTAGIVFHASGEAPKTASRCADGPFAGMALAPRTGTAGERIILAYP